MAKASPTAGQETARRRRRSPKRSANTVDALASKTYVPSLPGQAPIEDPTMRRLVRLTLDLHDGPLQDLAAAGFRLQSLRLLLENGDLERIAAGLTDVQAYLGTIEQALRSLVEPGELAASTTPEPFAAVIERSLSTFRRSFPLDTSLEVTGDVEPATNSQRIALERVLREALSNVAKHSDATRVDVRLAGRPSSIRLEVEDDGIGFDVKATLVAPGQRSRLGLAGMVTRLKLLDGTLRVDSRQGGPTRITATIRRWQPPRG